jgi:hypothetical protein
LLGGLESGTKKVLTEVFRALVPFLRFSPVEHQAKAENFALYHLTSTTATSTSEFSILHGLGKTPYFALPTLDLTSSRSQIVTLEVTRPADAQRIYLKASSTNAPFSILVE